MLLSADKSQLLIVDVQERLLTAMDDPDAVTENCARLLLAAAKMGVPAVISEQYPKGLGPTASGVLEAAGKAKIFEKLEFSCAANAKLAKALLGARTKGRNQVIIAGIEAHVCVLQTGIGLHDRGFDVFVVADAISSRKAASVDVALSRMTRAGVRLATVEMVIFEWLEKAGTDRFKELSALVK